MQERGTEPPHGAGDVRLGWLGSTEGCARHMLEGVGTPDCTLERMDTYSPWAAEGLGWGPHPSYSI